MGTQESKGRVLVVDDEAMLVENLAAAARDEGYEADAASNGREALELLQKNRYELIVTDLKMPQLDGAALMDRVATMGNPPQIIAITGYASLEAAVDCLRKGASDFLVKPFEVEDFLESVRKVMSRASTPVYREPDWQEVEERYGLTRRQLEVLNAFYRTGKSNRELADELFLSPHTVKSHLKASFEKIGVSNRAQLLRTLHEM